MWPSSGGASLILRIDDGSHAWSIAWLLLHLIAGALLIAVIAAWGRRAGRRGFLISGFLMVSVAVAAYLIEVAPADIPIDWITIIHEGLGYKAILHLYNRAAHAGSSVTVILNAIAGSAGSDLHHTVWLNLLLAIVNAIVFLHLALRVTSPIWAVVWTAMYALNPPAFFASFSELPANLLGSYMLAGMIAWAVLYDDPPQPRWARRAAYVLCGVLTVLVAFTRSEVALVGITALTVHAAYVALGPQAWSTLVRRLKEGWAWSLAYFSARPGLVALLSLGGFYSAVSGVPGTPIGRPLAAGIYPFNPLLLSIFFTLPTFALPFGVSIAIAFGYVAALSNFRLYGGLALSLLILLRSYVAATDQYYETGRYLTYVAPALFFLGACGKRQLDEMSCTWSPNWSRGVRIAYMVCWFHMPMAGMLETFLQSPDFYTSGTGWTRVLPNMNTQREVRHLLTVTEQNPECIFVGRVVEIHGNFREEPTYLYAVFGKQLAQPVFVRETESNLDDLIAMHAPGAPCVRLYYGGDCNLNFTDGCKGFIAGRRLLTEDRFWSRLYNNPFDYGYVVGEEVLATYAWP